MIHNKLRAAREQISQSFAAVAALEGIGLIHLFPGERTPLRAQFVAQAVELLLLGEKLFAGFDPRVMRNNRVIVDYRLFSFPRRLRVGGLSISRMDAASRSNWFCQ